MYLFCKVYRCGTSNWRAEFKFWYILATLHYTLGKGMNVHFPSALNSIYILVVFFFLFCNRYGNLYLLSEVPNIFISVPFSAALIMQKQKSKQAHSFFFFSQSTENRKMILLKEKRFNYLYNTQSLYVLACLCSVSVPPSAHPSGA